MAPKSDKPAPAHPAYRDLVVEVRRRPAGGGGAVQERLLKVSIRFIR